VTETPAPLAALAPKSHPRRSRQAPTPPGLAPTLALAALVLELALPPGQALALEPETEVAIVAAEDAREAGPALLALLTDADAATRERAALAVGRIGRPEDVPVLAPLLQDPEVTVRRSACFALGEIEDSTAAFPLEELLLSGLEPDAEVRELAVHGLGKLGRGAEACRAALRDGAETVQARALLAAWRIPGAPELEETLQFSQHKRVEVRWCAAYCLMRLLGAPASGATPIPGAPELTEDDRDRIASRLLALTEESDARVVLQAARGLRTRPEAAVTARMQALLAHEDWRVRVEALRTLGAELPTEATDTAADTSATAAASDAGDTGTTEAARPDRSRDRRDIPLDTLTPLFDDPNPNVVATLLEALARIGGDEALGTLFAQLENPRARHRELALLSLAARLREARGSDGTLPQDLAARFGAALDRLQRDPVWSVAATTAEVGDLLPEEAQGPFYLGLARQEGRIAKLAVGPYLDWRAARTEGWPRPEQFEPELGEFLAASDPMVVLMTLNALGEIYTRAETALAATDTTDTTRDEATGDGARDDARDDDATDTTRFQPLAHLLEAQRLRFLDDPLAADVRQTIADLAGARVADPAMEALLLRSANDPAFPVRRAAIAALTAAGREAPRAAGPVETRHGPETLRSILEWSRKDHRAVFETAAGTFEARLFAREAPLTCWNFAQLAEAGFYDGGAWHRVVPDFVLQDGCPRGDGWGGPPDPIRCEINRHEYGRGALGMALSGKDTGGSQFFFTHAEQPHLDGGYTVFGELVKGRTVADLVAQGDPITRIRVVSD
jgi:cyclophilin family peptidyl-prolyl cis-trans isomerase/HEAT repeat protein